VIKLPGFFTTVKTSFFLWFQRERQAVKRRIQSDLEEFNTKFQKIHAKFATQVCHVMSAAY
jgi:hypothetical protein